MGSKELFLGLGRRRAAGACVSAVLLLAGCTQVVARHAKPDPVALASYLSSSSSSAASVSSSKAAVAQKAVCSQLLMGYVQYFVAWNAFVDALNGSGTAEKSQVDDLVGALSTASAQIKAANTDASADLGGAATAYTDALDRLAGLIKKQNGSTSALNDASHQITDAEQKLMRLCPN